MVEFKLKAQTMSEYEHLCSVIEWSNNFKWHPFIFHVPNEINTSVFKNPWPILTKRRKSGVKPGVADLLILYPRDPYHGMIIELKAKGKKPTKEQQQFLNAMNSVDYYATWSDNLDDTLRLIRLYLGEAI